MIPVWRSGVGARIALTLTVVAATCLLLCAARVESVHSWMMRHDCPIAKWTMNKPTHPIGTDGRAMARGR